MRGLISLNPGPQNVNISPSPSVGGWTPYSNLALTNSVATAKPSSGKIGTVHIDNTMNMSEVYVQFFDQAAQNITLGTTTPTYVLVVPAYGTEEFSWGESGLRHSKAINIAATTTPTGLSPPGNPVGILVTLI